MLEQYTGCSPLPETSLLLENPRLLTTEPLVAEMTTTHVAEVAQMHQEGLPTPTLDVVVAQAYGERLEHLLEAVSTYATTGILPGPEGDNISYLLQIIKQCGASGINLRIHAGREVREDPRILEAVVTAGLDPIRTMPDNELLGVLDDLAQLQMHLTPAAELRDYFAILHRIESAKEQTPAVQAKLAEVKILLEAQEQEVAALVAHRDARLEAEIKNIATVVAELNDDPTSNGMLALVNGNDAPIRAAFTNPSKDLDNLSSAILKNQRRWSELTPRGMMATRDYFRRKIATEKGLPNTPRDPARKYRVQAGAGKLVGGPLARLFKPGLLLKESKEINGWLQSPDRPVSELMTATRGAWNVKVDRLTPGPDGTILVIDAGCVSVRNPITGNVESRGNVDPASVDPNGPAYVGRRFGTVGPVVAAELVGATIQATREQYTETRQQRSARIWASLGTLWGKHVPTVQPQHAPARSATFSSRV